jgi:phage terminase large subunit
MTSSIAHEVAARRGRPTQARRTMLEDFGEALKLELELATRIKFPSPRYQAEPVAFFREILGVEPWAKQVEVIEAIRDHKRVAVSAGHKVSKSHTIAGIALWFYCSFDDARAVMTSTTARQVDQILWRELRMMRARSGRCAACKLEDPDGLRIPRPCPHSTLIDAVTEGELARTGLKSADFREVVGFTAREAEAVAGISGRNLLYLADEASGIPDEIFEAIEGNRAGGARIAMFSNPTRNDGEFYEAFTAKAALYKTITISSEETPNVVQGREVIPGLATREWIEEKKVEWGVHSALYSVRVKGKHALNESGKIFSIHAITEAERRWPETPDTGRLFIGLDPAGETGTGDETCFAPRRGLKLLGLEVHRGLNEDGHLALLLQLIAKRKLPRETPVVVLDREGSVGAKLYGLLRNYAEANPAAFELVAVRSSERAVRQAQVYDRIRDELVANLEAWIRDGGAIVEDTKLEKELHAFEWRTDLRGRVKATPKDVLKKLLGRSPDRFDGLALSVWEPLSLQRDSLSESTKVAASREDPGMHAAATLDPYGGSDAWERR